VWNRGLLEVPKDDALRYDIVRSHHDCKLAGHPGRAKTLALVKRCFTWPSVKQFVNRYVDGCDSCQRSKPLTLQPMGTLQPLPIPAGPWTDISYDMITDLPESNGFDSILTVIDRLTKMAHFVPCRKTMSSDQLADLMMRNVWRLHGTPKTIVLDRGSVFISQITRELSKRLGTQLQPSTAYHPRTDGQSEIAKKVVKQYL
jgi:transposase InsO family protein